MFLYCGSSYYLIQSPHYDQILTGVPPYKDWDGNDIINGIRCGDRPSRPTDSSQNRDHIWDTTPTTDPSQNRWLQDQIWDTITTCWSGYPERRCELSVVYRVFLAPSPPDVLLEFPPVGRKNLVWLVEELSYTFLILPLDPPQRSTLRIMQEYISNVILRGETSETSSALADAVALAETFRKVPFPQ